MSSRALRIAALLLAAGSRLSAQHGPEPAELARPLFVNDEWERYARIRQIAGDAPLYPWTVRTFTARESRLLAASNGAHPWDVLTPPVSRTAFGRMHVAPTDMEVRLIVNSAFPYGYNDGEVWAGRGLTSVLSGGVQARVGHVSAALNPLMFRAENAPFTLRPTGGTGAYFFADAFAPVVIDQPQRFGDDAYQRIETANSRVELDSRWLAMGISTAAQHWGPARDHPLVLGNNAGGFPHVYLGTGEPVNVFIGRLHTRLTWGKLDASEYSVMRERGPRYRFAPGVAVSFLPAGVPGLELGFSRFFHLGWSDSVLTVTNFLRPFIGIVRKYRRSANDPIGDEPDNQIASLFGRWVFPASGFEIYGEFAKDDYNGDFRDLAMQPDHLSGFLIGFQRVVRSDQRYRVFRAELLNTRISPLGLTRPQSPFYIHSRLNQGHTHNGQVLGSAASFGGGAFTAGVDVYRRSGRQTLSFTRMMRAEYRPTEFAMPEPGRADIFYQVSIDGTRMRNRIAVTYELSWVRETSRYFQDDATNLRASTGVRFLW